MALKFVNVTELHDKVSEILRNLEKQDVIVTYRGRPKALIRPMTESDLEDYVLAHHPRFQRALETAYQDVKANRISSLEDLIVQTKEELGVER
ncbi:MAG: hypothetical protein A2Z21_00955 [Candidatus Fraserbacteria bacterium RBG_16_55_9]|uniref:Antitoxin n=1 Tax=Fraserbacteria sp. (strain RBG_16_55_9) TaxID=1817864 RepID=A0A1F5UU94_FRAXR|nr:MAG: hypothetical protein A2Z21_00955 [Candidatus Fraserbacteria bacterium RBG_16_55_9]